MSTTRLPELAAYKLGDLGRIRCDEPDPEPDWAQKAEEGAHDLRSIHIAGQLVASFGYTPETRTQAGAFAVVDRQACAGVGKQVAQIIRQQSIEWMDYIGFTVVTAFCAAHDRQARVFLRAIGYRQIESTDPATLNFIFVRSKQHGQEEHSQVDGPAGAAGSTRLVW